MARPGPAKGSKKAQSSGRKGGKSTPSRKKGARKKSAKHAGRTYRY